MVKRQRIISSFSSIMSIYFLKISNFPKNYEKYHSDNYGYSYKGMIMAVRKSSIKQLSMLYASFSAIARVPVSTTDRAIDKSFFVLAACFFAIP